MGTVIGPGHTRLVAGVKIEIFNYRDIWLNHRAILSYSWSYPNMYKSESTNS